jgi:TetR/AcrR family transcriptional repressor of nem operon
MGKAAPTRDLTKKETRDALIAAATLELAEKGLETASLDAICARAGYTRGAFYVHFRDRDDLVVAVVEKLLTAMFDTVIASSEPADDLQNTVARYVARVAEGAPEVVGRHKWRYHHTLAACARSTVLRDRYASLQREAIARVATAARAGQRAGTVRRDVPAENLGEILVILTLGVGVMLDLEIPFDLGAGARGLARLLRAEGAAGPRTPRGKRRR